MAENWDDERKYENPSCLQKGYCYEGVFNNSRSSTSQNRRHSYFKRDKGDASDNPNEEQSDLYVKTSKLGLLIGKGGCQIRELQEKSGARVQINKHCINGDSTLVVLVGSKDALNQVKSMIANLIMDKVEKQNCSESFERNLNVSFVTNYYRNDKKPAEIDWDKAAREHEEYQRLKYEKYGSIQKNFYLEDLVVKNMTMEEAEQIRFENNNIKVESMLEANSEKLQIPNPVKTFDQAFKHYPDILKEIKKQDFIKPSPIQCQAWPILLSGKDMIGIAQTGTGKTLAFLLPALIHIDNQETPRELRSGPTCLIMAPTRELALQIEKEVNKYEYHGIKAICVYGGGDRKQQMNTLSKGVEIAIATPGRLNDLVQAGVLDVKCVSYLVLDEADRMLDMGFEPQIRKTLLDVRPDRQSVMTSATWPPGIRRLAKSYMKDPITVCVGSLDLKATHSVTQKIYIVDEEEKTDILKEFFQNMGPNDKVIVFFGKKAKVDDLGSDLALSNIKCQSIHGGREQCDREQALDDIKTGQVNILLATDVASRGIDIEDITHVFNYDFPRDIEEYVHRVGRTGRAGRTGESISLMTRKDWGQATELIKILEEAEQEIPEELFGMAERFEVMQKRRAEERDHYGDKRESGIRFGRGRGTGRSGRGRDRYGGRNYY